MEDYGSPVLTDTNEEGEVVANVKTPRAQCVDELDRLVIENQFLKMAVLDTRAARIDMERQLLGVERSRLVEEVEKSRGALAAKYGCHPELFQVDRNGNIVGG